MLRALPLLAAALLLGACSKAEKKVQGPVEKSIYISASDCEEAGKIKPDECSALVDKAVAIHEKSAPTFKSLTSCEETAGIERCERTVTESYRMRLQAFMITTSQPMDAAPLYPSVGGKVGFRDDKKADVPAVSDNHSITNAGLTVAHDNAKIAKNVKQPRVKKK